MITLQHNGNSYNVPKILLAYKFEFFKTYFESQFKKSDTFSVDNINILDETMETFFNFVMTNQIIYKHSGILLEFLHLLKYFLFYRFTKEILMLLVNNNSLFETNNFDLFTFFVYGSLSCVDSKFKKNFVEKLIIDSEIWGKCSYYLMYIITLSDDTILTNYANTNKCDKNFYKFFVYANGHCMHKESWVCIDCFTCCCGKRNFSRENYSHLKRITYYNGKFYKLYSPKNYEPLKCNKTNLKYIKINVGSVNLFTVTNKSKSRVEMCKYEDIYDVMRDMIKHYDDIFIYSNTYLDDSFIFDSSNPLYVQDEECIMEWLEEFKTIKYGSPNNDNILTMLQNSTYGDKFYGNIRYSSGLIPDKYEKYITQDLIEAKHKIFFPSTDTEHNHTAIDFMNNIESLELLVMFLSDHYEYLKDYRRTSKNINLICTQLYQLSDEILRLEIPLRGTLYIDSNIKLLDKKIIKKIDLFDTSPVLSLDEIVNIYITYSLSVSRINAKKMFNLLKTGIDDYDNGFYYLIRYIYVRSTCYDEYTWKISEGYTYRYVNVRYHSLNDNYVDLKDTYYKGALKLGDVIKYNKNMYKIVDLRIVLNDDIINVVESYPCIERTLMYLDKPIGVCTQYGFVRYIVIHKR